MVFGILSRAPGPDPRPPTVIAHLEERSKSAPSTMRGGGGGVFKINMFSGRQQARREEDLGVRVRREMWRDNGFVAKVGAAADDWGQKCVGLHLCCLVIGCHVCVRVCVLPLYQSSEASSQPLPCPWISRGLCRRSRSCLLHSSRRRAGPHALSAQTTSQGTTWHTDSRAHKHTHTRTGAHTRSPPRKKKKKKVCRLNWWSHRKKYTSHKSARGN